MSITELIDQRVSTARGGYRPEEVQALMREAYALGTTNALESIRDALPQPHDRNPMRFYPGR